ncbi:hypothetical protein SEA_WOFFORD_75 [Streptomyces phage Wofford]|uniref:Uncharacterized protein n=1 Tax=Streptomyces phage Wofford TaxID=2283267 RepID=A0A345MAA3_9CAUD|nr:hypothetical protein HWB78_gp199 [Streptomyces phage Wollford]AXH67424.1 hypothetical protein SEA_WOFFORD_75 [Streptomyces phage Wollford]
MSEKNERVQWGINYKHNLGNFENVDITAGVECDVLPGESIQDALERVSGEVLESFFGKLPQITEALEDQ